MEKGETNISSVSSSTSINFENYTRLLYAFKETHEEANRLTLLNNRLKGLNNWLENRVKALEEKLNNLINDFENLEVIYKTLLTNVTQVFVKIVNLLKRRFTILLKLWISFQKTNQILKLFFLHKNVSLVKLVWILIHRARKVVFQSLFQPSLKNN